VSVGVDVEINGEHNNNILLMLVSCISIFFGKMDKEILVNTNVWSVFVQNFQEICFAQIKAQLRKKN
jgi:hypothetical protein